jgi:acetylornithine aminotransferase/acetylornithine/N-succinyldiaminopimelate aminotransferase
MEHVASVGRHAEGRLRSLASRHPAVKDVRGAGVIWGIEIDRPAADVVQAALDRGLLINRTSDTVVRLLPAYIITAEEFDAGIDILEDALTAVTEGAQKR